ncbi:hypothetical protein [Hydrogenimonas sp.]
MQNFFYLEGGYLILGFIVLLVTLFVTTRPFMGKGAVKKGLGGVGLVLALLIGGHYWVTTKRMAEVKEAFERGEKIICENRVIRKGAQSIILSKKLGWKLNGEYFVSEAYSRPFFTARCIVYEK